MNQSTVTKLVYGAAFTFAACLASAANAGSPVGGEVGLASSGLQKVTVSYSDLDMTDTKARRVFQYRVSRASKQICGSSRLSEVGSLRRATKNKECIENAVNSALRQASSAQLAATGS